MRIKTSRLILLALMLALLAQVAVVPVASAAGDGGQGGYVVTEAWTGMLSYISAEGERTVIYDFGGALPLHVAVDHDGTYLVTECVTDVLSRITPGGERTVVYAFEPGTCPAGVAADGRGNYIVAEWQVDKLSHITPGGVRTVVYQFDPGTLPTEVQIDADGNYVVTEEEFDILSRITPEGQRTIIYTSPTRACFNGFAIDDHGDYIIAEYCSGALAHVTPKGKRTVIYTFGPAHEPGSGLTEGYYPLCTAIDRDGSYIVTEDDKADVADLLSRMTPKGERSVIYDFGGNGPIDVAIVPAGMPGHGKGVIQYWGNNVVDLKEDRHHDPLPYIPDASPLPGGRWLTEGWRDGSEYQADPTVSMDLISGKWYFTVNAIQQPSGVMELLGTGESYLNYYRGLGCDEGGGGWLGTFHGQILPNGDFVGNGNNTGCGLLEGWTMKHHEEWRGLDPDTGEYASRTFSGHFTPPSP